LEKGLDEEEGGKDVHLLEVEQAHLQLRDLLLHGRGHLVALAIRFAGFANVRSGTDVMIFKIFSPKNLAKKLEFFAHTTTNFCKKIIALVFENNANFLPIIVENRRKS
jgi:hypothetical protein